jgi:hypothetical protein
VAFAIGKLLQHMKVSLSSYSQDELLRLFCLDNFAVQVSAGSGGTHDKGWDVIGLDMVSPPMSLQLTSINFNSSTFFSVDEADDWGKNVDSVITKHSPFCCAKQAVEDDEEQNEKPICYAFGVLLHFIFSGDNESVSPLNLKETNHPMSDLFRSLSISPAVMGYHSNGCNETEEVASEMHRPAKSVRMPSQCGQDKSYWSLLLGPILRLVEDLLSCESGDDIYPSDTAFLLLDPAINDVHRLLLLQPSTSIHMQGRHSFCRVASSGQSEAFVIGGFSG